MGWFQYRVSGTKFRILTTFSVEVLGYPIPNFKVSGIGIRYQYHVSESRFKVSVRYRIPEPIPDEQ